MRQVALYPSWTTQCLVCLSKMTALPIATRHLLPAFLLALTGALLGCVEPPAERAAVNSVTSTAGLDTALLFDAQYYASLYPDLQAAFGNEQTALRNHWLSHGVAEGRRASPIFDCAIYFALNPDIAAALGSDCAAAMTHFRDTGLPSEGRRASFDFDVRYYLVAIVFLLFDVELLFLYPWAVASLNPEGIDAAVTSGWVASRGLVFGEVVSFMLLLAAGFVFAWRKGVFKWR